MSTVEREFLKAALDLGLAEKMADTLQDIDRAIADLPPCRETRHLSRLREQRASLQNPTLRITVALIVALCVDDPSRTPRIRRAFVQLVEKYPDLAWFYGQLPSDNAIRRTVERFSPWLRPRKSSCQRPCQGRAG